MPRAKHLSKPYLSSEARKALNEISEHNYHIHERLSDVSDEADLKVIADLAREKGRDDPFMLAVATAAERRLELFKRHRTGRGAWFAVV